MIQNPSQYQIDIFRTALDTDKNIVVAAVPGSGKTSTIISVAKLLPTNLSSCFLAFNKAIVDNLQSKLPTTVVCKTAHSMGMSSLIKHYRIPFKVNPLKNLQFIIEVLKKREDLLPKQRINLQFIMIEIMDLVKMNMLDNSFDSVNHICDHHSIYLDEKDIMSCIEAIASADYYNSSLSRSRCSLNFTDMIVLALNPKVKLPQFDVVFLDESQDMNRAQQALVLRLLKPTGRLIAVGDRNQSIYGFAGADGNSFDKFQARQNTVTLPLSISYRCGKSIVENAKLVYPDIESWQFAEQGEVRDGSYDEIRVEDMVICRNTAPLVTLWLMLLDRGQAATVVGKDTEKGLLQLLSKVVNYEVDNGIAKLDEIRLKLKEDLIKNGTNEKSVPYNKKYINLLEQITVIKVLSKKCSHMSQVEDKISLMFEEGNKDAVKLSTIHRAKGLEADRVFLVTHFDGKQLIPSSYAVRHHEIVQENNVLFVALTRAKKSLIKLRI